MKYEAEGPSVRACLRMAKLRFQTSEQTISMSRSSKKGYWTYGLANGNMIIIKTDKRIHPAKVRELPI